MPSASEVTTVWRYIESQFHDGKTKKKILKIKTNLTDPRYRYTFSSGRWALWFLSGYSSTATPLTKSVDTLRLLDNVSSAGSACRSENT